VADRGSGLTTTELGRVFEPFEHGDAEASPRGAGLGLAIARGFTHANGGILWAESRRGGGMVFVLSLPSVRAPAAVPL
jgi:signal transduction histidine kinase